MGDQILEARQGLIVEGDDPEMLRRAIDLAFDYRGDITIVCRGGSTPVHGYIFDRRSAASLEESVLRLLPGDGSPRVTIPYSRIQRLEFSGRDTAAGKSFQTWVKQYLRKKLGGAAETERQRDEETK